LKALGSSLIGPAGLGIALSVVSAGVLFYQQYQQRANKTTNDAKKSADDYVNSLGQLQQAQLKGATSAQDEITKLSLLYKQYQNQNIPLAQRKTAYEELQKLYPSYFKNIAFEISASDKTKTAYDLLTQSILANARAKAAADLITKNSTRQLENEQKVIDLTTESLKQKSIADKALKATRGAGGEIEQANALADLTASLGKQREIQSQINNLKTDSNLLTDKNLQLEKSIVSEKSKIDPKFNDKINQDTEKEKRRFFALINDFKGIAESGRKDIAKSLSGDKPLIDINTLLDTKTFVPDNFGQQLYTPFQILQDNIKFDLLPQLGTSFKTFFDDILMNGKFSFSSLGEAIKNTFLSVLASEASQGVLKLLGSVGGKGEKGGGLISGIAGLFGAAKKTAPLANIAKSTGGILGSAATITAPVAATGGALLPILAGVAAIAGIASLFKKKQAAPIPQQFNNVATTGFNAGSDISSGRVVFEISGTNLVGVLNRAGAKLQRFGP
jgi:hypothetical protein